MSEFTNEIVNNLVKFSDFFDPYNVEHIKAYNYLRVTGVWPEGFVSEENIVFDVDWGRNINYKMADAWVDSVMSGQINGIPHPN